MASEAYEQILAVQALDLSLRQLSHRHSNHPLRAMVAEAEAERSELVKKRSEVSEVEQKLERSRKRLEDQAAQLEDKRNQLNAKLYGGEITATKELLAIQEEMANLVDRRTAIEDEELETMEAIEEVDESLSSFDAGIASLDEALDTAKAELGEALSQLDLERVDLEGRRREAASSANSDLLARYEELSDQFGGVAVARLVNGTCDGCNIALSAVAADRMAKMADDDVVTCEECGRLLVR